MKAIITVILASALLAPVVNAQSPRYVVRDLGPLPGGNFSQPGGVNDFGLVAGVSTTVDDTQHAVLWIDRRPFDIAKVGLGGPNSGAFGVNIWGQVSVLAETSTLDPNGENFCGYGTHLTCRAALWQLGLLKKLPTLGGYNSTVGTINNRGQIAGAAETSTPDASCASATLSQLLQYEPIIWGPNQGEKHQLPVPAGDTVGIALSINDKGQAVGASGLCSNTALPPIVVGPHAVLWEKDRSVHDLGNLGAAVANVALSINNFGQVVGASSPTPESGPFNGNHAFLWTRAHGMRDLGTLDGDVASGGTGINDAGEVVGVSNDPMGNIRAFYWTRDHGMKDLNTLISPDAPLLLLFASGINSKGEIVGWGVHLATGEIHAFRAIPNRH